MSALSRPHHYATRKAEALEYLGGVCVECGTTKSLEFHHKDTNEKEFNVTKILDTSSFETLKKELDKCELRCHKHHRQVHIPEPKHGTYSCYMRRKCRCELCRAANAKHSRDCRAKQNARRGTSVLSQTGRKDGEDM
jgi:hypothetical protein